jgi:hypothetical protein
MKFDGRNQIDRTFRHDIRKYMHSPWHIHDAAYNASAG